MVRLDLVKQNYHLKYHLHTQRHVFHQVCLGCILSVGHVPVYHLRRVGKCRIVKAEQNCLCPQLVSHAPLSSRVVVDFVRKKWFYYNLFMWAMNIKNILWHFPTLNWNTWGPVEKVSRCLKAATMQLKMFYHFRSFFLPLTFLFKILFQKLFLLICKVSLSAYNWTSTTVSLLAGWGNWVILPSISIVICYFFLIQTSIFFTFRKTITIWIFLYIHGVS